ncbi:glycosyltransferase family 4 protein [Ruixingdingia sedimenti]|uniref:Glycosyltransferase family 1 protein n=1 Tax=Ruixingdingia sedimenti TaxID=3073604 RepID=A0ABU1F9K3_9RHOB|nr:glycosyltransferase family 1 protein [Xinfangfangia sp. LG-4]MDR5653094.1 glycosyltransferase family 1 protein [Xinfangfangia sp. LG-4]
MPPPARLLDLSRMAARLDHAAPTGIDRVERAYLRALLARPEPLFALTRSAFGGACLLDRQGAARLLDLAEGRAPLPARAALVPRLYHRSAPAQARADSAVRALALARAGRAGLARMLRRHLPEGVEYLNTGHANLRPQVFAALRQVPGARITVLVHDMIPLDHPHHTRPDTIAPFAARMRLVGAEADRVIYNSAWTRTRAETHFAAWGRVPPGLVAHLGTEPQHPDPAHLPPGFDLSRPYFVTLGTIEPRKNHALLLDVWDLLAERLPPARMPRLVVAGRRGWADAALLARLDRAVAGGAVVELAGLDDPGRAALLQGARALLFPSHDEGFGLPLTEAMALRLPAVCSPLPVFREIAGDYPVYLETSDVYAWAETIEQQSEGRRQDMTDAGHPPATPGWDDHFKLVLSCA